VYNRPKRERTLLITILSPLLFLAPEGNLQGLEKLWTDDVIIEAIWKSFIAKMLTEWEGVILWVRIQRRNVIGIGPSI
jgi:hypothetical protein